jgi:hypothetical protein
LDNILEYDENMENIILKKEEPILGLKLMHYFTHIQRYNNKPYINGINNINVKDTYSYNGDD